MGESSANQKLAPGLDTDDLPSSSVLMLRQQVVPGLNPLVNPNTQRYGETVIVETCCFHASLGIHLGRYAPLDVVLGRSPNERVCMDLPGSEVLVVVIVDTVIFVTAPIA